MSGLILLAILAVIVMFLLLAGGGLLFFLLRRNKKGATGPGPQMGPGVQPSPFVPPQMQSPPMQFGEPERKSDDFAPQAAASPFSARDPEPWGVPGPSAFETRGEDRARDTIANESPSTVAMHSNMGPSTSPARDQSLFETTPSADADSPYSSDPDPFATTPNAPPVPMEVPGGGPRAVLRAANGVVVHIDGGGMRIGRHPDCQFVIPTPGASRHHAEIRLENGMWVISDLNSGNGTFVNGVRVRSHQLVTGDEVRIDQTLMTFSMVE